VHAAYVAVDRAPCDAILIDVVSCNPRDAVGFIRHVRQTRRDITFFLYNDEAELEEYGPTIYGGWGHRLRLYFTQPRTAAPPSYEAALDLNLEFRLPLEMRRNAMRAAATQLPDNAYSPDQWRKFQAASALPRLPPPSTASRPYAFVIRAHRSEFDDVYRYGIEQALAASGLDAKLAKDDYATSGWTADKLLLLVRDSALVVAEMTLPQPNCYYELGLAVAMDKPSVVVARDGTELEFDLAGRDFVPYRNSEELRPRLLNAIRGALARAGLAGEDTERGPTSGGPSVP
jgi:hypothetical protein